MRRTPFPRMKRKTARTYPNEKTKKRKKVRRMEKIPREGDKK